MTAADSAGFCFTFDNLEVQYRRALELSYEFLTCVDFARRKEALPIRTVANRIDIDVSVKRAERLGEVFARLGITGTFFVRIHAPE
jgi:hypothetical protein